MQKQARMKHEGREVFEELTKQRMFGKTAEMEKKRGSNVRKFAGLRVRREILRGKNG